MQYNTDLLRAMRAAIGENIRARRAEQKMPLFKLARLSGVNVQRLDHYELGKSSIALDELLRIACVFDVRMEALLA